MESIATSENNPPNEVVRGRRSILKKRFERRSLEDSGLEKNVNELDTNQETESSSMQIISKKPTLVFTDRDGKNEPNASTNESPDIKKCLVEDENKAHDGVIFPSKFKLIWSVFAALKFIVLTIIRVLFAPLKLVLAPLKYYQYLTTTLQRHKDENVDLRTRMQRIEEENDQKSIENTDLKKVNELLHEDNNNIIQQLQETNINKNNEIRQHRENNSNLSNEIEQLREENDDMSKEIQDLHQKNNNMEIEIEQLQEYTMCSFITESGTVAVSNEVLGKGGWGAVYTGDFYGTKVAVKEFYEIILSPHNMEILKREINIASQCRHPNLLQFICATKNAKNQLLIVTELMDMALRAFLEQQARENSRLKHPEVKLISLDVARGLNYLHSKKPHPIIHRDVSSANVLLWIENGSVRRAKLSDYGAANFMQACNTSNPGAALYAAPEARRAQHDPKIDVFSYGLLVCEMTNCKLPHPEQFGRKRQIMRIPNAEIKELVGECTKMDLRERPTMQDVIERWQEI